MPRHIWSWTVFLVPLVLVALASVAGTEAPLQKNSITVVYNHESSPTATGWAEGGGFSAYVRLGERSILFDVGGEATLILENLQRVGADLAGLDAVVISHNHWDHLYGLPGVMSGSRTQAPVYVPAPAAEGIQQQFPRATVVAVQEALQIAPGVWLTEPMQIEFMGGTLSEQALVLDLPAGLHIITGCSHPGIVRIVENVKRMFPDRPIALVAGGFHLRSTESEELQKIAADLERLGVRKIGPSHCTGDAVKSLFRERWQSRFVSFDLGDTHDF
jgi:7,8-dihydropterin-6-yl-methyl-4-(beta-D-ribofuranosyl)aminobenzene 5'-phosphate synthase